ncbi:3-phosphoshikimate 1-carboxyvinyltransferase [Myroides odoratus]|uniref:3-phosphoshikimate 1-carboxyvinyltransferase n=1 Tax=Myroides odoratus TaxID=256 RepID=A0A9Q6Z7K2_MYROD|nr:3-phosphoshikimate 1-carboxyvinyltransferase [Myroides odoratus]EHQ43209.1 3-phosphoshikimate 1-carboxyvinyltransferase [Myroides odoratus DSM 2801]EKB06594.1 3-phosphoshikimate 1-carboxyvinyltransferase [Myroides odoratus CIP 103059]QQU00552.1 3-phosphoshikimate 1-carboxyvinyltransferase [Myroides odoratus]WQD57215.1 3-phosphoshikimate 1-carboxyvinyltransferase [Myroides odoratus]STZ30483.1 3-phosphoshikimate 1-carboxyvinyltransferase [Myroides odoratus]
MQVHLQKSSIILGQTIVISGSKSESNRLLLLQKLFPQLVVENVADSDDVVAMQEGLAHKTAVVDVHHAGTAMRFLTAYFALCQNQTVVLEGSERMRNRPIAPLVDALRALGAQITYTAKEGFPPLRIDGIEAEGGTVEISAAISSQYISALLLVGTRLKKGITIQLLGEITSRPYIEMTLSILRELGAQTSFEGQTITVFPPLQLQQTHFTVEADWSSASYYYSLLALSPLGTTLRLGKYKKVSLQGDSILPSIYAKLGVETVFEADDYIRLTKRAEAQPTFEADFNDTPDLAQTVVVSCFGLGIACHIQGLHTLKIKETDRLVALQNELAKLGGQLVVTADSLTLDAHRSTGMTVPAIDTYQDHRMAMAFAPLVMQMDLLIHEAEVVSKSYPAFWKDLRKIGLQAIESK